MTPFPPLPVQFPKYQRVLGRSRGENRCPFSQPGQINVLQSTYIDVQHLSRFIRRIEVLKSAKMTEVVSSPGNRVSVTMTLDSDQDQGQDQDQSHLVVTVR